MFCTAIIIPTRSKDSPAYFRTSSAVRLRISIVTYVLSNPLPASPPYSTENDHGKINVLSKGAGSALPLPSSCLHVLLISVPRTKTSTVPSKFPHTPSSQMIE